MKMKQLSSIISIIAILASPQAFACTGISLKTSDGSKVIARTIEWGGSNLNSLYVIVPRGHTQISLTPEGFNGKQFTSKYGYVGLAVESKEYIAEGINERGLAGGLFYFPGSGKYVEYNSAEKENTIADLQLVSYILGRCSTIEEVKEEILRINIVNVDPRGSTLHWRFAQEDGKEIIVEIIDCKPVFYENTVGVITNSPRYDWHITNLNNYINLQGGNTPEHRLGNISFHNFGHGSSMTGLPGDFTPPSRFVRAAFFVNTAPVKEKTIEVVEQCFHILNNFDIPIGTEFSFKEKVTDIPSATQWTSASDLKNRIIYFRTMYNSEIRYINLKKINFGTIEFQAKPLDEHMHESMTEIEVK